MRTLTTIGDLYSTASPLRRQGARRKFRTMGATNPNFVAPGAGAFAQTAGDALQTAAFALQNKMDAYGVPSEHVSDPDVLTFQQTWNQDPATGGSNASYHLDEDGAYGPNTSAALDAITGLAQAPNTSGTTPATPATPVSPGVVPVTPAPLTAPAAGMSTGMLLVLAAAAAGGIYLLFFRKKKRTSHVSHAIVKVNNPRRRRGRR